MPGILPLNICNVTPKSFFCGAAVTVERLYGNFAERLTRQGNSRLIKGMEYLIALAGSYLLGTIPFGLLLTRFAGYGDIRAVGSGNIGATNVLRLGNKKLAAATLLLDGVKGAVAILCVQYYFIDCSYFVCEVNCDRCTSPFDRDLLMAGAGMAAVLGHVFPVWLRFKGGKGVATTLGIMMAINPLAGILACGAWLLMAYFFRYSSLSALTALAMSPALATLGGESEIIMIAFAMMAALVFYTHRANIGRLRRGEEPKIGKKKE